MDAPRIVRIGLSLALAGFGLVGVAPMAAAVSVNYHCTSAAGSTDTDFTITADAPGAVVQGATFDVTNFIVTGTPPVDLLLARITLGIKAPANATTLSPTTISFDGPGSTVPPGPIAKKGIPNPSPPMIFTMTATGVVGSVIEIFPADVVTKAVDPANLNSTLDVTCSQITPTPVLSIQIVAGPATVEVLGTTLARSTTAAAAAAVRAAPTFTG